MDLTGKKVLVTGGTGMVGCKLVDQLLQLNCDVTVVSLDDPSNANPNTRFVSADIRYLDKCEEICDGQEIVFHVAGIKGSPELTKTRPASFFVPMMLFNTAMLEAAQRSPTVKWTMYTSTVGVYGPASVFEESKLWDQNPSPNDWYAGWAKRMGEVQLEAYAIENGKRNFSIIRPVNIYGSKGENFNPKTSMVIQSLVRKFCEDDEVVIWGDGKSVRDFVNARDVASAMIYAVQHEISLPLNVGSGVGYSISELAETIRGLVDRDVRVTYDINKPSGDRYRVADISRIKSFGWTPKVSLRDGLRETIEWYKTHKIGNRYDAFLEKA